MSHQVALSQPMLPSLVSTGKQLSTSAPSADPQFATLQWLLQQQSEDQSSHSSSPGIMISQFSSSEDNALGPDYSFTQESENEHGSWSEMYPLQIHVNGSEAQHPQLGPSSMFSQEYYPYYASPNEANSSSYMMMNNHSPNGTNTLSPFAVQPSSSLPQMSPGSPDLSGSPTYGTSRLSTPTTPASTHSFIPSPTLSQGDQMLQQDLQVLDLNRSLFSHRQQLQMFREALSLPYDGAGHFIPQPMYKPHTASDRKRYVEEVGLEAPIYFFVEHNQCGISLHDALHSRVKNLVDREHVVFEGRGPSVSIRLEWPGYRQWSRQIPTKDFRSPPGPITIAKLAKNVAKCVQRFMLERKSVAMEEGSDERWRVGDGPGDIKLEDLLLVSIHHVSLGSWQPQLRLRRAIPIRSSLMGSSMVNNVRWAR